MTQLFGSLRNLQSITICSNAITGQFFRNIPENITSIGWKITAKCNISSNLTLAGKGGNLKNFSFTTASSVSNLDLDLIASLINEMPNLMKMKILSYVKLRQCFHVNGLEKLDINLKRISLNCFQPMYSLKKLDMTVNSIREKKVVSYLKSFPNLQYLHLSFTYLDTFTLKMIESLCHLRTLKSFYYDDFKYKSETYSTLTDSSLNSLCEAVSMMSNVSEFDFLLINSTATVADFMQIILTLKSIAVQRPSHVFRLRFQEFYIPETLCLPENLFVG
ncbi:hypothetical protein B4U80_13925 [Leptotrombidium deliense]|uniref:Uncharacterized protein n=1 Tax=Leptotrombidium deliense TaxID=299467 RepID=A0A443S7T4_9ACAR|nr:hypothetical protein B4U80_13925 [Leptotrombidium deliense]